jgi:starch phosphorylase
MTDHPKIPRLPEAIARLDELAMNLSWAWTRHARRLFARLDPALWAENRHNPIALLAQVTPERLAECPRDAEFMKLYDLATAWLDRLEERSGTWFGRTHSSEEGLVAYFCAEFGIHNSVPIYSGGLGVLAGDHVKTASDLGIPMVGVGLLYARGYFDQQIDEGGWQDHKDETYDVTGLPLTQLHDGDKGLVTLKMEGREVRVGAWEMTVGRTRVILLDTNLDGNEPDDRELTGQLYGVGEELRLKQEWILGVGGVRVLRALGLEPACWHANEGHAAFMLVERVREALEAGRSFDEAVAEVRGASVFTTHTPVPAGHDNFHEEQIERCIGPVWDELGIEKDALMRFGLAPDDGERFHMTAAAIRLSTGVNGVSRRHGVESRRMWKGLWPDLADDEVPIGHITNGVHRWTWMTAMVQELLEDEVGPAWSEGGDPRLWDRVLGIDERKVWDLHLRVKLRSFRFIRDQARRRWRDQWPGAGHLAASGPLLDPEVLTLGFARRFATYKRADLVLRHEDRLLQLLTDSQRPVQIIFSGKAHPADDEGKRILQRIWKLAQDARMEGRVAFLEDYDMHVAHRLFHGVDVWLNVPRVPMEASGTSGMKAALNLVPQLGTPDGWWAEGFNGTNGWSLPLNEGGEASDEADWQAFFDTLESDVVPLFYDRDSRGVPARWVRRMKHAVWVAGREFTTERMLREYAEMYYLPALRGTAGPGVPPTL